MSAAPPPVPKEIAKVISVLPASAQRRMKELRGLIHDTARECAALPIAENLKWGQPSFAPPSRIGTALRLGWTEQEPDHIALLVHCQTSVVDQWREMFGAEFAYDGNRALHIPTETDLNEDALKMAITTALRYRRPL